jgi:hypothetical protein
MIDRIDRSIESMNDMVDRSDHIVQTRII